MLSSSTACPVAARGHETRVTLIQELRERRNERTNERTNARGTPSIISFAIKATLKFTTTISLARGTEISFRSFRKHAITVPRQPVETKPRVIIDHDRVSFLIPSARDRFTDTAAVTSMPNEIPVAYCIATRNNLLEKLRDSSPFAKGGLVIAFAFLFVRSGLHDTRSPILSAHRAPRRGTSVALKSVRVSTMDTFPMWNFYLTWLRNVLAPRERVQFSMRRGYVCENFSVGTFTITEGYDLTKMLGLLLGR